jgi:peptide-methionine (R)-S-oxide reductase
MMTRRSLLRALAGLGLAAPFVRIRSAFASPAEDGSSTVERLDLSDEEWKKRLTPAQYAVLREEDTERPFSSPLNHEKRAGVFQCVACELPLFSSEMKFDSGTGWPSFFDHLPDGIAFKTDFKLIYPRKEYHCARCGGHQGHVFDDGPAPTGKRYCNNGICLKFVEA